GDKQVVVLSHGLWERRFGADPSIINKTVTLDGSSYTIIGVMPQTFKYPANAEVWTPVAFAGPPQSPLRTRELHFLRVLGNLKPGVTFGQAQAESDAIAAQLAEQYPKTNAGWSLHFVALQESIVGNIRLTLFVLFGAVGCVLLIACANVANLLLAHASSRQKEM